MRKLFTGISQLWSAWICSLHIITSVCLVLQATVNFAISCFNSSCLIMDCQQGLKPGGQHGGQEWASRQCVSNPYNNWHSFLFWYIPFNILPITYLDGQVKIKDDEHFTLFMFWPWMNNSKHYWNVFQSNKVLWPFRKKKKVFLFLT